MTSSQERAERRPQFEKEGGQWTVKIENKLKVRNPRSLGACGGVNESSEEEEEKDLCLSERPNPAKADGSLRLCQS